jgi:glycosyltransferase involved in cell wall biosynthesis
VASHIVQVLSTIPADINTIYVVDDQCPEETADLVESLTDLSRVKVIRHEVNRGVGGAVKTGYRAALADGADIVVKLDGDGQMDPLDIHALVAPIVKGMADYTKGNRFYDLATIHRMPLTRLIGNAILSFLSKLSSGYWGIFDPTNGFTAVHARALQRIPLEKLSDRYFFESDMLFRLNTIQAVVIDVPMESRYGDEKSSLRILRVIPEFIWKHGRNLIKRILYNYYLRDMSIASLELPLGLLLCFFGLTYGFYSWYHSTAAGVLTPPGTVMLSALPVILGFQLVLAFLNYDISSVPTRPIHQILGDSREQSIG